MCAARGITASVMGSWVLRLISETSSGRYSTRIQNPLRHIEECFTFRRGCQSASLAGKQFQTQICFKNTDLPAKRGLADVHCFRRRAQGATLHDQDVSAQAFNVHLRFTDMTVHKFTFY